LLNAKTVTARVSLSAQPVLSGDVPAGGSRGKRSD
jgi:hypothetical protein